MSIIFNVISPSSENCLEMEEFRNSCLFHVTLYISFKFLLPISYKSLYQFFILVIWYGMNLSLFIPIYKFLLYILHLSNKLEASSTKNSFNQCIFAHCERMSLKKRDSGTFLGHLSFWVSGMESPLIFLYTKKIRKKY